MNIFYKSSSDKNNNGQNELKFEDSDFTVSRCIKFMPRNLCPENS